MAVSELILPSKRIFPVSYLSNGETSIRHTSLLSLPIIQVKPRSGQGSPTSSGKFVRDTPEELILNGRSG